MHLVLVNPRNQTPEPELHPLSMKSSRLLAHLVFLALATIPLHAADEITFSQHIAPLVHENCASCHRPGEAAPFSLLTYEDVRKRARTIARVLDDRYMPPWHPVPGHGDFVGERRLSDPEIALFNRWIDAQKPEGDPAVTPAPPEFPKGWQLGTPDLVVQVAKPFDVPADGPDIYRSFVIPLDLPEDKWVKAIELRPAARSVVHHVLFFLDDSGTARARDGEDGQPGFRGMGFRISGRLGGYVPGSTPGPLPDDLAWPLPAESDLVLQTHFHPVGKAATEQLTVGLFFADTPPSKTMVGIQVPPGFGRGMGIDIPPGEDDYRVEDSFTLPVDVTAYTVGGHAHYVCQEMQMTATFPNGRVEPLLYIDDWDLNWQDRYTFKQPVDLPAGTVLKTVLVYDNSESNPDNPFSPPRQIAWGRESTDEMGSITLSVTAAEESDTRTLFAATRLQQSRVAGEAVARGIAALLDNLPALVHRADANADGRLQESETPPRLRKRLFENWDRDRNGELDPEELAALYKVIETIRAEKRNQDA